MPRGKKHISIYLRFLSIHPLEFEDRIFSQRFGGFSLGRRFPYTSCVGCMITKGVCGLGGHGKNHMVLVQGKLRTGFLSILIVYSISDTNLAFSFCYYIELSSFS
jgi:hypothetical protein